MSKLITQDDLFTAMDGYEARLSKIERSLAAQPNLTQQDAIQQGVVNGGDLLISSISVNGATGALTFTIASGIVWVKSTSGIFIRNVFVQQTITQIPSALPASGNTQKYGVEIDTTGVLSVNPIAHSAGNQNILSFATEIASIGKVRLADISVYNNAGTYQLSSNVIATQGVNWIDRRPWSRGYFGRQLVNPDASFLPSVNLAVIDQNLSQRVECSGAPIRMRLQGHLVANAANGAVVFTFFVNGASVDNVDRIAYFGATSNASWVHFGLDLEWETIPTPGSNLIQPAWRYDSVQSVTFAATGASPNRDGALFVVEELSRQSATNGII